MWKGAARHDEHFNRVVENCGVAAAVHDDWNQVLDILTEELGLEQRFARFHPVDVAAQRVDLAVVRNVTERMRERPTWKGIRAEALVNNSERGNDFGISEIGKV